MTISQELEIRIINAYDLGNTNIASLARVFECKTSEVNTVVKKHLEKDHPFAKYFYKAAFTMGEDSRLGTRAVNVVLNVLNGLTYSSKQKWLNELNVSWHDKTISLDDVYVDEAFYHLRIIDSKIIKQSRNCGKKVYEIIKNAIQLYKTINDSDVYLRSKYYRIMKKFDNIALWKGAVYEHNNLSEISITDILKSMQKQCRELSDVIEKELDDYNTRKERPMR